MTNGPVIVKLGGSVLTRKREVERLRPKLIERLTRELVDPTVPGLVVLHGAGSFGHPGARRFRLAEAPEEGRPPTERQRGGAIVAREVRRLHAEVLKGLVAGGGSAFSLPAFGLARNRAGRLASLDAGPFRAALSEGLIPVSFGDVVPDDTWGLSILSADTIALELARLLGARRVVFVSDVPGILPSPLPPGPPRPIKRLTPEVIEALRPSAGVPDVTGGIRRKAEVMVALAQAGVPAGLVGGLRAGTVARAVSHEPPTDGTWALPS